MLFILSSSENFSEHNHIFSYFDRNLSGHGRLTNVFQNVTEAYVPRLLLIQNQR